MDVRVLATDLDSPSALSPISDGRLLFLENSRRVRVIANDQLLAEPALELPPTATRLVGLAVDHQFDQTHSVFVSWTEESGSDLTSRVNITRYRELQNSLAQGATIVSGLLIPAQAIAPLAVDRDGLLYVALPGAVLRFTRDGSVPLSNPTTSPILAHTLVQPGVLAVDSSNHVLIAGRDADQLVLAGVVPGARAPWLERWAAPSIEGVPRPLSSDLAMGLATGPDDAALLVAMGGRLFKGRSSTDGVATDLEQLHLRNGELAFAAAAAPDGQWYVVTGRQDEPQQLRLIRKD